MLMIPTHASAVAVAAVLLLSQQPFSSARVQPDGACPLVNLMEFGSGRDAATDYVPRNVFTPSSPVEQQQLQPLDTTRSTSKKKNEYARKQSFSFTAAAVLAMDHFNNRDTSVVPELGELKECSVYFPPLQPAQESLAPLTGAVEALLHATSSGGTSALFQQTPCAILGPLDQDSARDTLVVTSAMGIPQLDYSSALSDSSNLSTDVSTNTRATAVLEYLERSGIASLAVLQNFNTNKRYQNDAVIERLTELATSAAKNLEISLFSVRDLADVKQTGISAIYIDSHDYNHDKMLQLAESLDTFGMLAIEYIYIFSSSLVLSTIMDQAHEHDLAMDKLLSGAFVFDRVDGFTIHPETDAFLTAWGRQNWADANFVQSLLQNKPDRTNNNFQLPMHGASFVYDSIMTIGIGACHSEHQRQSGNATQTTTVVGGESMNFLRTISEFHGASGLVAFEEVGGRLVRGAENVTMGVYNIRRKSNIMKNSPHLAVLTSLWTESTGWTDQPGVQHVYRDGSTTLPTRHTEDVLKEPQSIEPWVRVLGLSLMGVNWAICIAACIGLAALKHETMIRRSQPFYLQVVCVASILTSSSIFTLSWDEHTGWSNTQLDGLCVATPWLFFTGQILATSALFTKLWRINHILRFQQRIIPMHAVACKLLFPLALTSVVLIVWSLSDPLSLKFTESLSETYATCQSDHFAAFFALLTCIVFYANIFTLLFACKTKQGVPTSFRDHKSIIFAMAIELLAWVFGLLILAIKETLLSATAVYVWKVSVILVISMSTIALVVLPKIAGHWRKNAKPINFFRFEESDNETGTLSGSGGKAGEKLEIKILGLANSGGTNDESLNADSTNRPVSMVRMETLPPEISAMESEMEMIEGAIKIEV